MLPCHLSGVVLGLVASLLLHLSAVDAGQPVRESAAPSPKIVEGRDGVRDVFVLQGTVWQNLTAFKLPQRIYSYAASPDGRYVFVWHEAKPPRVLTVYDVSRLKPVKDIVLGFGGEVRWNRKNDIIHTYGCGSGCMAVKVIDITGAKVFEAGGRPMEISPSGRYLAIYTVGWVGQQDIEVYDLSNRNMVAMREPIFVINGVGNLESIRWNDEKKIAIEYTESHVEDEKYVKREVSIDMGGY